MKFQKEIFVGLMITSLAMADDQTASDSAPIIENDDLPKLMYVVPWKEDLPDKTLTPPKLVLQDLMGDLYEPQLPISAE